MADNQVSVEITLEEKAAIKALTQLSRKIQQTEKGFEDLGKSGDKNFGALSDLSKGVSDGFGSLVKGVTVANLASDAIIGVGNEIKQFVVGSINAAIQQENAINKLGAAIKRTGEFTQQAMNDFEAFASSIQQNSTFGDEVVLEQLAIAKSYGLTNERAKQLVAAATELSATFGTSLDSNVKNLGKSMSGLTGELGEALPIIKTLTAEQLKAGGAIDLVNTKFAGAARAELDTYQGSVKAMSNAYSDLQEQLGAFVTTSSTVSGTNSFLKGLFEELTESLKNYRIEMARGQDGFKENQESVNQLSGEYAQLTERIEAAKAVIAESEDPNTGFFQGLFLNTAKAKEEIRELTILQQRLFSQINSAQAEASASDSVNSASRKISGQESASDDPRVKKEREVQIQIALIREQARIAELENKALVDESLVSDRELEIEKIYEFEALKLEAQFSAEEEKAALIKDSRERNLKLQEISAKRELEFTKLSNNQIKAENQKKIRDQEAINARLLATASNFLAAGQLIAKDGSNTQKALQVTQATINTYAAANNALAQPVPYPVAVAMAASAVALGLANVAKISGAKFEQGGIVSGNSFTGDLVQARVNSGEMILNRQQQSELFRVANGSGSSGNSSIIEELRLLRAAIENRPVYLEIDGRSVAIAVRSQVQAGFRLT